MSENLCPCCGQALPEVRLGVRLTPLKARIFDMIQRGGPDGVPLDELHVIGKWRSSETLKAHIWQINDVIADEGYRIKCDRLSYALVKLGG